MRSTDRLNQCFSRHGLMSNARPSYAQFYAFLSTLTQPEPYDNQVASEIWDQTLQQNPQPTSEQLAQTIADAQNILVDRLISLNQQVDYYDKQRSQGRAVDQNQYNKLCEDRQEFEEDLRLLTEPFGMSMIQMMTQSRQSRRKNQSRVGGYNSGVYNGGANSGYYSQKSSDMGDSGVDIGASKKLSLKWLLYLTVIFGLIEIIIIYGKYDFLNLMVVTVLLFIFLMNHFDSTYIKFCLALLIVSEVLDVVWLFMKAGSSWNPPKSGNHSSYEKQYLRFIVIFTFVIIFLKIPLGILLFHYRNASPDKQYRVKTPIFDFRLKGNVKNNPVAKGVADLGMFFAKDEMKN